MRWNSSLTSILGLLLIYWGISRLIFYKNIVITKEKVIIEEQTIRGRTNIQEPVQNYTGIKLSEEERRYGQGMFTYKIYILHLMHQDKKRIVKLYEQKKLSYVLPIMEQICLLLHLPPINEVGDNE